MIMIFFFQIRLVATVLTMVRLMTLPPPPPLIAGVGPLKADETKAPLKPRSLV
jgi:hypothetical protein